jgi:hypothetical protein
MSRAASQAAPVLDKWLLHIWIPENPAKVFCDAADSDILASAFLEWILKASPGLRCPKCRVMASRRSEA